MHPLAVSRDNGNSIFFTGTLSRRPGIQSMGARQQSTWFEWDTYPEILGSAHFLDPVDLKLSNNYSKNYQKNEVTNLTMEYHQKTLETWGCVFPAGESDSAIFGSPEMVAGEPGGGQLMSMKFL